MGILQSKKQNFERFLIFLNIKISTESNKTELSEEFMVMWRQEQPLEVFCKKVALRNFAKFTGKHLPQSLFFNKVKGFRPATLLKIDTLAQVFSYEFCEISKSTFFLEYVRVTVSIYLTKMKYLERIAA